MNAQTKKRKKMVTEAIAWLLVACMAVGIFLASAHTGSGLKSGDDLLGIIASWLYSIQDAVLGPDSQFVNSMAHFLEYALFGVLLYNALRFRLPQGATIMVLTVVLVSAYGVTDEVHQYFVPGRACDPMDWVIDTAGGICGSGILFLWERSIR